MAGQPEAGGSVPMTAKELVELYLDSLYRYACRLTGSDVEAEDLVQETFLIASEKFEQLREPARAFAWLVKILRGCWSREHRRKLPLAGVPVEELQAVEPGRPVEIEDVDAERVLAVLESLPDEYRDPLLLFYFEELRYRDIADVLGLPLGTVMSRIARAKAYLRERLVPAGVKVDERE